MRTVLLPPGVNPIAVNKYIITYHISRMISKKMAAVQYFFLRFLILMIKSGLILQVKFGTELNCNIFTHYMQNNSSFKLFRHETMLIHSLSLLYFLSQNNGFRSIHIPWLAQSIVL